MMQNLKDIKPELLWHYFDEILAIPRPSGKEEKILAYLVGFAKEQGLEWKQDDTGNILITKEAAAGFEKKATIVLQSHVDMVCEKNDDTEFDFLSDKIEAYIEDGWVRARGTTLGADNGIGIATQMALLEDKKARHGKIECLFTVDEESGLTGAFNLPVDFFHGRYLINLDSEDDGELFIGCAGGIDTFITVPLEYENAPEDHKSYRITIEGLQGGHSGDDIHKSRGNANKILARLLFAASGKFDLDMSEISGGNLRNAIPREAYAIISFGRKDKDELLKFLEDLSHIVIAEKKAAEPHLKMSYEEITPTEKVIKRSIAGKILKALNACPNGVIEMSYEIPDLVQSSSNLASIRTYEDRMEIITSQRSSVESSKLYLSGRIRSLFELLDARVTHSHGYPGWKPNPDSAIVRLTAEKYEELFGEKPIIRAIHAGLECGLFLEKYPYLDMVSFGPTIKGAHSPAERIWIDTVVKFWNLLLAILEHAPEK